MTAWVSITSYPKYGISIDGEVCNIKTKRILKQCPSLDGYLQVCLASPRGQKTVEVHRLMGQVFLPVRGTRNEINHIDGVKANNSLSNLERVTRSENLKHAFRIGLKCVKGEKSPTARLTLAQVEIIRGLLKEGKHTQKEIGKMFNVSNHAICKINVNKNWKHI